MDISQQTTDNRQQADTLSREVTYYTNENKHDVIGASPMRQRVLILLLSLAFSFLSLTSCMEWDYGLEESFDTSASGEGLFICNEGNFQYGNATLSYYDPESKKVENEVFYRANAMKLGDVAQSMIIRDSVGWVVVNNSHVVFAIDINTFKEVGRITNFTSPRYMHFISDE